MPHALPPMPSTRKPQPSLATKKQPAQQRATETFERILEVTAQTLADVGIERLSTNLVCERAGLTPPALYRYFPNKYALLSELGQRLMQRYDFELTDFAAYEREIAPARTFGFMRDLKMMNELGLGSGGRLDNFILVGEDNVINTALRFPDEFVRHKILDIVGDLYLLGFPLRGKLTARLTGHRDNIALVRLLAADV